MHDTFLATLLATAAKYALRAQYPDGNPAAFTAAMEALGKAVAVYDTWHPIEVDVPLPREDIVTLDERLRTLDTAVELMQGQLAEVLDLLKGKTHG